MTSHRTNLGWAADLQAIQEAFAYEEARLIEALKEASEQAAAASAAYSQAQEQAASARIDRDREWAELSAQAQIQSAQLEALTKREAALSEQIALAQQRVAEALERAARAESASRSAQERAQESILESSRAHEAAELQLTHAVQRAEAAEAAHSQDQERSRRLLLEQSQAVAQAKQQIAEALAQARAAEAGRQSALEESRLALLAQSKGLADQQDDELARIRAAHAVELERLERLHRKDLDRLAQECDDDARRLDSAREERDSIFAELQAVRSTMSEWLASAELARKSADEAFRLALRAQSKDLTELRESEIARILEAHSVEIARLERLHAKDLEGLMRESDDAARRLESAGQERQSMLAELTSGRAVIASLQDRAAERETTLAAQMVSALEQARSEARARLEASADAERIHAATLKAASEAAANHALGLRQLESDSLAALDRSRTRIELLESEVSKLRNAQVVTERQASEREQALREQMAVALTAGLERAQAHWSNLQGLLGEHQAAARQRELEHSIEQKAWQSRWEATQAELLETRASHETVRATLDAAQAANVSAEQSARVRQTALQRELDHAEEAHRDKVERLQSALQQLETQTRKEQSRQESTIHQLQGERDAWSAHLEAELAELRQLTPKLSHKTEQELDAEPSSTTVKNSVEPARVGVVMQQLTSARQVLSAELSTLLTQLDDQTHTVLDARHKLAKAHERADRLSQELERLRRPWWQRVLNKQPIFATYKPPPPAKDIEFVRQGVAQPNAEAVAPKYTQTTALASDIEASTPSLMALPVAVTPDTQAVLYVTGESAIRKATMTTETSPLRHVNQVLALHGAVFVEAIYRELLGREPDPQGAAYYLSRLQYEQDKTAIVCDFAMSPEGRARIQGLDGLNELVALRDSSRGRLRRFLNKFSRIERSSIRLEWGIAALRQELLSEVHAEQAKIDAALATLRDLSAHIDNRFSDCSSKIDSSYENICRELSRISHVQQETSEQLSRYEELRQLDSEMQIRRTARGSDRQGHHSAGFSGTGVASYALNMGEQANVRLTLNDLLMLAQNARKPRA